MKLLFCQYYYGEHTSQFLFQTPWLKIVQYGLPPNPQKYEWAKKWIRDDTDRMYIKIPYILDDKGCDELKNMMEQIDKRLQSEEIFKKLKLNKEARYSSIIKQPYVNELLSESSDSEDELKTETKKIKYDSTKFKFSVDYSTKNISTKFFVKRYYDLNKTKPEHLSVQTVSDLDNYITWHSQIRMVVKMTKVWKTNNGMYGASFNIVQMEIKPGIKESKTLMDKCINCVIFNHHLFTRSMLKKRLDRDARKYLLGE